MFSLILSAILPDRIDNNSQTINVHIFISSGLVYSKREIPLHATFREQYIPNC